MLQAGRLRFPLLSGVAGGIQWVILLALSVVLVLVLEVFRLPAALLLGPMIASVMIAVAEGTVRVPDRPFILAQGVLGCMIARSIPFSTLAEITRNWPLFVIGVASVIAAASALGWALTRWRVLPGTTAIWGSSPGAATAMMLMAEAYGADVRLVAFMQYLRVVCVAVAASLVASIYAVGSSNPAPDVIWFPAVSWAPLTATVALAGIGAFAARLLKIPAGPLLLPLTLGVVLQDAGGMTIDLPPWLLALSYALIGWSIGLRFTRPILAHAVKALPHLIASTFALIAICGVFAAILVAVADIDPLTAYLATSPGGADSVAIIAASSKVDLPFVMAMQTARFVVVLLTGPRLARFFANRVTRAEGAV